MSLCVRVWVCDGVQRDPHVTVIVRAHVRVTENGGETDDESTDHVCYVCVSLRVCVCLCLCLRLRVRTWVWCMCVSVCELVRACV